MRPAEQLLTCLNLSAADVPCKTAPFASFSGRAEKEGPARPERGSIYEIIPVYFDKTIFFFDRIKRGFFNYSIYLSYLIYKNCHSP